MERIRPTEASPPRVGGRPKGVGSKWVITSGGRRVHASARKGYGKPGRPRHVPSSQQLLHVIKYAKTGIPLRQIAALIGVSINTLMEEYRDQIELGRAEINSQVGGKVATLAKKGEQWAATLWARTQMGWKDTTRVEHTGRDGAPIAAVVLTGRDPQEATRAYLAMIAGDDSHDPHVASSHSSE